MKVDGPLPAFGVQDICNEALEQALKALNIVCCLQTAEDTFNKLYFANFFIYDKTDYGRRFRMPLHLLERVKATLVGIRLLTSRKDAACKI